MQYLKGAWHIVVGIGGAVLSIMIIFWLMGMTAGVMKWAVYAFEWLMPYMTWALWLCILVDVISLLLACFQTTRGFAAAVIFGTSFAFGFITWVMGFLATMYLWGAGAVIIGLFFFGVGVVPIGMLAAVFKGEWSILGILSTGLVLTFGARLLGIWLLTVYESRKLKMMSKTIELKAN